VKYTHLPEMPKGGKFEEFVASFLQQPGRYVERQLREKEQRDVLELDVVLTDYSADDFETHVVEVKSGDWGFTDLFKLCGQMRYLEVETGHVVALGDGSTTEADLMRSVGDKLCISVQWVPAYSAAAGALEPLMPPGWAHESGVSELWRYSHWLDRCLTKRLVDLAKSTPKRGPRVAREIDGDLQTNLFSRDLLTRTAGLYASYRKARHLSARWCHEELGADFDTPPSEQIPAVSFRSAYYHDVESPHDLDIAAWIEHRMRVSILKNAVDYTLSRRTGRRGSDEVRVVAGGQRVRLAEALPQSFVDGVEEMSRRPWMHLYPVLWQ
jgi:hypothetical protein